MLQKSSNLYGIREHGWIQNVFHFSSKILFALKYIDDVKRNGSKSFLALENSYLIRKKLNLSENALQKSMLHENYKIS